MLFSHLFFILRPIGLVETLGLATPLGSTMAGLMFLAVLRIGEPAPAQLVPDALGVLW